jgi:hypothetical protein
MLLELLVDVDKVGFCGCLSDCLGILKSASDPPDSSKIARIGLSGKPCLDPSLKLLVPSRLGPKLPHDAPKALPLG